MVISGKIVKKKALTISAKAIDELCVLIKKHCNRVTLEAETLSGTNITFETIEELINYDNFKNRRIKELQVTGYNDYQRTISVSIGEDANIWHITNYNETVRCAYQFNSIDTETVFKNEFSIWFEKNKSSYWWLGKFSLSGAVFIPSVFITLIRLLTGDSLKIDITSPMMVIILLIVVLLGISIVPLTALLDKHILGNLFPPVAFLWGEEIERFGKWNRLRSNLLWGVIIAIVVGLLSSYLFDTLKNIKL